MIIQIDDKENYEPLTNEGRLPLYRITHCDIERRENGKNVRLQVTYWFVNYTWITHEFEYRSYTETWDIIERFISDECHAMVDYIVKFGTEIYCPCGFNDVETDFGFISVFVNYNGGGSACYYSDRWATKWEEMTIFDTALALSTFPILKDALRGMVEESRWYGQSGFVVNYYSPSQL